MDADGKSKKKQKVRATKEVKDEEILFFEDHSRSNDTPVETTTAPKRQQQQQQQQQQQDATARQCHYGMNCKNPYCKFKHDGISSAAPHTQPSGPNQPKKPCRYGSNCKRPDCIFAHGTTDASTPATNKSSATTKDEIDLGVKVIPQHLRPCRFGLRCSKPGCPFNHGEVKPEDDRNIHEVNKDNEVNLSMSLPSTPPELRHKQPEV